LSMLQFCKLLAICISHDFMLLMIPKPKNTKLLILCDAKR